MKINRICQAIILKFKLLFAVHSVTVQKQILKNLFHFFLTHLIFKAMSGAIEKMSIFISSVNFFPALGLDLLP